MRSVIVLAWKEIKAKLTMDIANTIIVPFVSEILHVDSTRIGHDMAKNRIIIVIL